MTFRYHSDKINFECPLTVSKCTVCKSETYVEPLCPTHVVEKFGVAVRKSSIEGAGLGLYTLRAIRKGELICPPYLGKILTKKELDDIYGEGSAPYTLELRKDTYVDAACQRSWAAFINHAPHKVANAKFAVYRGVANVRATRNIEPHSEILVNYGKDYFRYKDNTYTQTTFPLAFESEMKNPFNPKPVTAPKRHRSKSPVPGSSPHRPIVL